MAKGSFVISAENKIKEGLDAAQRDLEGFSSSTQRIGDAITKALTVTAIVAGLKKLGDAAFACYKEFGVMERYAKQLSIALGGNEASVIKNTNLIEKLTRQTLESKDSIKFLINEIAALGKSDAEIDAIATAAVNLSNVTGTSLDAAFRQINGTYAGTIGRLAQLIPEVKNLTTEQLAAGEAVKLINNRFGELSRQLADDNIPQKLKNIKDTWGDLRESIGQAVAPIFNPFLDGINRIITGWNNAIKAAQIHKQLLTTSAWDVKISLNEELLAMNTSRLEELAKLMKPLEKSTGGNMTLLRQNQQYMAWASEKAEIDAENQRLSKEIADLKARIAANPGSPLAGGVRVPLVGESGSGTGGTTKPDDASVTFYDRMAALWDVDSADQLSSQVDFTGKTQRDNIAAAWDAESADALSAFVGFSGNVQRYWAGFDDALKSKIVAFDAESADSLSAQVDWSGKKQFENAITAWDAEGADTISQFIDFDESAQRYYSNLLSTFDERVAAWDSEGADSVIVDWDGGILKEALQKKSSEFWANQAKIIDQDSADSIQVNYLTAEKEQFENAVKAWDSEGADALSVLVDFDDAAQRYWAARGEEFNRAVKIFDETSSDTVVVNYLTAEKEQFENAVRAWDSEGADALSEFVEFDDAVQRYWAIFEQNFQRATSIIDRESADALSSQVDWTGGTRQQNIWNTADAESADALSAFVDWPELSLAQDAVVDGFIGFTDALDNVSLSMGDFGLSIIGPLSEIMAALGPFGQMIAGMNPLLALLIPVIEGFTAVMAPALTAVIQPLMDALTMLGTMLGQALLPILDALAPIVSLIASILMTVLAPVIQMLAPIIQAIVIILQPFSGIIATLAKVFTILMAPVQWLADLFSWVGEVLKTFAWNIMHPFRQQSGPGSFYSDAFSGLSDRLAAIDALAANNQTISSAVSSSTASTASQSASYRTQQITINIYQQAPVVGSGGMDEFVGIIRTKFGELAYFGATA